MTEVAKQATEEPTNKLVAGTQVAGGLGAIIAGIFASFGGEALKGVITELVPSLASKPLTVNFAVFIAVTIAGYFATQKTGQAVGYYVLDKPNIPLEPKVNP